MPASRLTRVSLAPRGEPVLTAARTALSPSSGHHEQPTPLTPAKAQDLPRCPRRGEVEGTGRGRSDERDESGRATFRRRPRILEIVPAEPQALATGCVHGGPAVPRRRL